MLRKTYDVKGGGGGVNGRERLRERMIEEIRSVGQRE